MEILLYSGIIAAVAGIIYLRRKNFLLQAIANQTRAELDKHKSAQEEIRLSKARLKAVLEVATDKMTRLCPDGTILEAFTRNGFHSSVPERRSVGNRIDSIYDESIAPRYQQAIEQALLTGRMQSFMYDSEYCGRMYGREVRMTCCGDELIVVERDATERIETAKQLRYLSSYDSLTGLLNYNRFEQELCRLSESKDCTVGVVVCDLDGIRLINDTLGRAEGDKLLIMASDILKRCFCPDDCIARIGDDEFVIILPGVTADELAKLCQKLEAEVAEYNAMLPNFRLSLAVGSANACPKGINAALIAATDNMQQVKHLRGDSVRQYIIDGIFRSVAVRDHFDVSHPERIEEYVIKMAEELGLDQQKIHRMRLLARYHDIGTAGLDERVVLKPGRLTGSERKEMTRHSEIGSRIARYVPEIAPIADLILKHHEQWDGKGYPLGLKRKEIPIECRVLAIADAYEVMTAGRSYSSARNQEDAIEELRRGAGRQFDPLLVDTFIALFART